MQKEKKLEDKYAKELKTKMDALKRKNCRFAGLEKDVKKLLMQKAKRSLCSYPDKQQHSLRSR